MKTWIKWAAVVLAACAFVAPASAGAATVVNGDFETGNLDGWQVYNSVPMCGDWFAYTGNESPIVGDLVAPPPQESWAAITDQADCGDTAILYQDVSLEAGWSHHLSMYVYYESFNPIVVPSPNTLDNGVASETVENQQMRVDVIKPGAPIETVNPDDILATVFANKTGDPEFMDPTVFNTDLSSLAGQTVRLRAAVVAGNNYFHGSIDDVKLTGSPLPPPAPPAPPAPSNTITRGKLTLNKKNGSGKLAIVVPGPGTLTEKAKGKKKKVKPAALTVTAGGTVQVPLKPTALGRKILNAKGKLKTGIEVTFTPTGGSANTQPYKIVLKKTLKP